MKRTHGTVFITIVALMSVMLGLTCMDPLEALSAQTSSTIWSAATVPGTVDSGPDSAVELGVKFRSDSAGSVNGIRFYKAATNTGTHVGNLWSSTGTLLATATFANETASGWQQVSFATPVTIAANTVYVASYHTNTGHYSFDLNYFTGKGVDSPPLHALADGTSGYCGVFAYGSASKFPNLGWKGSNYWVDVSFSAAATSDTSPPTILTFSVPAASTSRIVPISALTATDNVGVSGYLVNESAAVPTLTDSGWSSSVPASYTFASEGSKTLYAWARDLAGNVSARMSAAVLVVVSGSTGPEPSGWYTGDMHVHRSCGGTPEAVSDVFQKMTTHKLSVMTLLADMGNGEVQTPALDLPRVTAVDDPLSTASQIAHWDAEWHWDATYTQFSQQALGGHVVALGLSEAHQIWEEYTYPIFDWARKQSAIAGFAHMQYLDGGIPQTLDCCTPLEYPVEVALGSSDFISEDVNGSDTAITAYYRLLNTGFRPGLAAGTDYPCSGVQVPGSLLTYVKVDGEQLTYRSWIEGIAAGRTVVSRNGHNEFLDLKVNGSSVPGDEIKLTSAGSVQATVTWTTKMLLTGSIELVHNGVVVASRTVSASSGIPEVLTATVNFTRSGWLAARRMDANGHQTHTGALFVLVNNAPIRASVADAEFFVQWIDNLLNKTATGGAWSSFFVNSGDAARARYQAAKALYQQIAIEAAEPTPALVITNPSLPAGTVNVSYTAALTAGNGTLPYTWTLDGGSLPAGLSLNGTTGVISGIPVTAGTFTFTVQVADAAAVRQTASSVFNVNIGAQAGYYTIWPGTTIPSLVDAGPDSAVELGIRFRADVDGLVTGIRFYKASTNTGIHVGNLWSNSGAKLASATFSNETASGWQQVSFATPVAITANTFYVASYHTTTGHYSDDLNYFVNKGVDNPPLHSPTDGLNGYNGVYAYGSGSSFPNQGWMSSNYWVDVTFLTSAVTDTTAPIVTAFSIPGTSSSLTVAISSLTATDNVAVTGYLVNESATAPSSGITGWTLTAPTVYTSASTGSRTLYAWAKDAGGNVSAGRSATVVITLPDATAPTVTAFSIPGTSSSLTVAISSLTATDNVAVSGYLVNESATAPSSGTTGWTLAAPTAYTFVSAGSRTLYAWAKDASANVSAGRSATVVITLPDAAAPTVTAFTIPTTSSSLTVTISSLTATDNVAVTGYLVNESAVVPSPNATGWSTTAPNSYSSATEGSKTLYAWAKDAAGNVSASRNDSVVITLPAGGPILVITSTANPFTSYYGEILRAEGFNAFALKDIASVTATLLAGYDLVILGEMTLTTAQVAILDSWVDAGGQLIAMHPDSKLADLLGLNALGSVLSDSYLLVNAASGPGIGIVNQTIQYHGAADLYSIREAASLATLYSTSTTATANPAVTLRSVGTMGGQAAAFVYDLARSVVYTRQGNPAWAGQERDGYPPVRSDDLFYGNASTDPRPNWVDMSKIAIPQADEQQRLLANMIIQMNLSKKPLPRFWYFPRSLPAVVVMSGDDHGGGGTSGRFNEYKAFSPAGCSVADWKCVRSTTYIFPDNPSLSSALAAAYVSEGFEVALHLNTECVDWTPALLRSYMSTQLAEFRQKYASIPTPSTNRTHCIVWSDYATKPAVEQENGIGLDTTYYFWPSVWVANIPGLFTGSGIPMKFADAAGNLIHVFQVATQMTDESGQVYPFTIDTLLDRAIGAEGYYGAFAANMHTDSAYSTESDAVVSSALKKGIPVISARQLLEWLNARNAAKFSSIDWNGITLSFSVSSAAAARGLVAMAPVPVGKNVSRVTYAGNIISHSISTVKGIRYVTFEVANGAYQVVYIPVVGAVTPADGATGVGTGGTVTATFSEAMLSTSITSGTFQLLDQTGSIVSATVVYNASTLMATLSPAAALANSMKYTGKVKGGTSGVLTAAGKTLTSDYTWSFTTIPEAVKPVVTSFDIPSSSASLNVPVTFLAATDNVGVTGYLITETSVAPLAAAGGWSTTPPVSYISPSPGSKTLYAWAKDAAGNVSSSRSASVVITVAGTYSIWLSTSIPGVGDSGPDSAVELGIRFRSDSNGYITGIRFYKASTNTGTHVGNLWSTAGKLLATATFSNETASGWQQVSFATPVAVTANTLYVASYHTNTGHYSCDLNYFAISGVDRVPLHAPVNTTSSLNGVYAYGSASNFPNQGWKSSNYWVDVVMQP